MITKEYKDKLRNTSEILKAIGHPTRLCIVCKLMQRELNVSEMQECLVMPQSTVSQHLSILKSRGIIEGRRNGSEVIYSLVNEEVKDVVKVFFEEGEIPNS
ncbi:HTH-type transcriptional repressor SmtB [Clostridium tepidiprofundi DSM 19306]|uniref:HTH-type transcriptional repressor SmtB n=1 Tax=Clostridium tepidiprofundi DSM 19306 TaxID=1121338 RepID=A0A151B260_9CLOT|nr:metalloregulator ArsR/SmtB family transcription factor [Clostridium tepidiprofundi]KYH33994.1 HTH-type transcriptional repressor SmtB [Clostridium tepidiprofundi DSM 19306]